MSITNEFRRLLQDNGRSRSKADLNKDTCLQNHIDIK